MRLDVARSQAFSCGDHTAGTPSPVEPLLPEELDAPALPFPRLHPARARFPLAGSRGLPRLARRPHRADRRGPAWTRTARAGVAARARPQLDRHAARALRPR